MFTLKTKSLLTSVSFAVAITVFGAPSAFATTLDLTTSGSSGSINGAFFTTTLSQSTGTGVIDPFVRLQDNGVADGYNASARPVMPDVNTSPTFTHDLVLSSVPIQNIGGIDYYEFLLDINQSSSNPLLSLDKIQIYTRSTALTTANTLAALTSGSTLVFDLDTGGDNVIYLNYNLNSGSGSGDMFMYVPKAAFGTDESKFVYLYSEFGSTGGNYAENDGFEEWAVKLRGTTTVPEPASIALLGVGLLGLAALRKKIGQ